MFEFKSIIPDSITGVPWKYKVLRGIDGYENTSYYCLINDIFIHKNPTYNCQYGSIAGIERILVDKDLSGKIILEAFRLSGTMMIMMDVSLGCSDLIKDVYKNICIAGYFLDGSWEKGIQLLPYLSTSGGKRIVVFVNRHCINFSRFK